MTEQEKREKVIKGLEKCAALHQGFDCECCEYYPNDCNACAVDDAIALLKAQEHLTIEPKRIDLDDETKEWLDEMDAVDALGNIANICIDWDGYRTANGLGGLINEIWAYARYCADRLAKAQEPVLVTQKDVNEIIGDCPKCGQHVIHWHHKFCTNCGQAVKWK